MSLRVGGRAVSCAALAAGMVWALGGSPARACGAPAPIPPVGLPAATATAVSTATSLIVFGRYAVSGFVLQAGGQDVPLSVPVDLGAGAYGAMQALSFWQLKPATPDGFLLPNTEHVLTATYQGGPVEVTRFTTGAGYDKAEGAAPVLNGMHLWRVRYPIDDIGSGNCVFGEYHGFITVDYVPGTVPNTPPSSVVHTFRLAPKNGGSAQQFSYVGATPFAGEAPTGAYPMPAIGWQPELDPTRQYCLEISAFGDGDLARLPVTSQPVCTGVVQLSAPGAAGGGGGGCAVGGRDNAAGVGLLLLASAFRRVRRSRRHPSRPRTDRRPGTRTACRRCGSP
jgi:hypothetical protein